MGKFKYHKIRLRKKHFAFAFAFGLFGFLAGFLLLISLYFSNRVLPNVVFAGKNYGGMTYEDVKNDVNLRINNFQSSSFKFSIENKLIDLRVDDFGVSYNADEVSHEIFNIGRVHKLTIVNLVNSLRTKEVNSMYKLNYDKLVAAVSKSFASFESYPKNSSIVFSEGKPVVVEGQSGRLVDLEKFYSDIKKRIDDLDYSTIEISLVNQEPQVSKDNVGEAYSRAQELVKSQVLLSFGQDNWTISGQNLFNLLRFTESGNSGDNFAAFNLGQSPIYIYNLWVGEKDNKHLAVSIDESRVDKYLAGLGKVINKPKKDATLKFENGKVSQFTSAQDGQVLNTLATKKLLLENLSGDSQRGEKIVIKLPVAVEHAQIANDEINSMGIKELIGSGVSYFAGSIASRVYNIGLGSSLINGALVKPGGVFSFDNLVGPVSKEQGFQQAYVINAGRTVLDDGGGICQVSTTVFRAALNAGLPILERTAHAYRVGYYEQNGFKAGLDATIFSPNVDLKFKNDTDHYILVQTAIDKANTRLQVDIYGTKDGRTVELSEPVVSNITPAPAPKYQDEPTLPKGVTKQVDFAAAGATSVFTRKVYKDGRLIIDDVFKSNFRPWQAVFLVGTG